LEKYKRLIIKCVPCCNSDKETLVCDRGTVPGSEHIALKCDTVRRNRNVLKSTMWNGAHKLKKAKQNITLNN